MRIMRSASQLGPGLCYLENSWSYGEISMLNNDSLTFMQPLGIHGLVDSGSPQSFK